MNNYRAVFAGLCASLSLCMGGAVQAQFTPENKLPYFDQSVIAKAIRSMDGKAEGMLAPAQAKGLQQMTRSNEPIYVTVQVTQRFQQFECARVNIDVTQEKVPTTKGELITFKMPSIGVNICTDGNPPDGSIEDLPKGNWAPTPEMFNQQ